MSRQFRIFCARHGVAKTFDGDNLPRATKGFDLSLGLFDGATLEQCSKECLAAIEAAVVALKSARRKTREELRADVQAEADAARGYKLFRPGDNDSLSDGYRVPEGTATVATDRTVPESVKPLFVDQRTGTYFTRTALKEMARTDTQRFRILMRNDNHFLNELLAQAN